MENILNDNNLENDNNEVLSADKTPSFATFAESVYPFLEITPFHRTYYDILDAYARGRIRKLIVSMPPQHGTSMRTIFTLLILLFAIMRVSFSA